MSIREVKLTNTLTGKKEVLKTFKKGHLTMYSCGPTVYGLIHVGNLRTAVVSDMFFKYFRSIGYKVNYVRNYTDIDDKIINRANEENKPWDEIAKTYIAEVEKDYAAAGMEDPTQKTLATDHVKEMHQLIEGVIKNGCGYEVDGEVFFSVADFKTYGKLSNKEPDDLIAGARVEVNDKKKNPLDFSLWKPAKPGEPSWDSPWGKGRPGWHIECSAMSSKWLGEQIDIHHGATDLIFPHHENEIAQSEAASGKDPFVRCWVHNGLLNLGSKKMSKSLGNIVKAREFLTSYGGEFARYFYLSIHYRAPMDFTDESVSQALHALERIYEAKGLAEKMKTAKAAVPDPKAEVMWGEFVADCEQTKKAIGDHLANDLNTAGALGELFTLIRKLNKNHAAMGSKNSPAAVLAAHTFIDLLEKDLGNVLGVFRHRAEKILADIQRIKASSGKTEGQLTEEEILELIEARNEARNNKDFQKADSIRDDLKAKGVAIKDSAQGTTWKYE